MSTARIVGLVILVAGVVLLIFGLSAADAPSEEIIEGVTGRYSDKTTWYIVGGIAGAVGGGALLLFGPKK